MRYNIIKVVNMDKEYELLLLSNQVCFPTYAVANKILRRYQPLLKKIGLTYTQYVTMMVLWEEKQVNEKLLCETLCLKSNTVAPLLKKLEDKGFIKKEKDKDDERNLVITLTKAGEKLQDKALCVPEAISKEFHLAPDDAATLYSTLYKMLDEERAKDK